MWKGWKGLEWVQEEKVRSFLSGPNRSDSNLDYGGVSGDRKK